MGSRKAVNAQDNISARLFQHPARISLYHGEALPEGKPPEGSGAFGFLVAAVTDQACPDYARPGGQQPAAPPPAVRKGFAFPGRVCPEQLPARTERRRPPPNCKRSPECQRCDLGPRTSDLGPRTSDSGPWTWNSASWPQTGASGSLQAKCSVECLQQDKTTDDPDADAQECSNQKILGEAF